MNIVLKSKFIINDIAHMTFEYKSTKEIIPGQFVNILVPNTGFMLRRPFSIFSAGENTFSILMKIIGKGTEHISAMNIGEKTDILIPLGNGFACDNDNKSTLLVAGGIGLAGINMFITKNSKILFGDKDGEYEPIIRHLKLDVMYISESGRIGKRGMVSQYIDYFEAERIIACGPRQMLRALKDVIKDDVEYYAIYEEIMACGIGLCSGCSVKLNDGTFKKVCKDGPVFDGKRIVYE